MSTRPTSPRPLRLRAVALAAWSLVVTGCGHTVLVVVSMLSGASDDEQRVRDVMAGTVMAMGGLERDFWQLFQGFSLLMALLLVGLGALNLLLVRRHPGVLLADRAVLWVDLAVLVPAWGLSVLLLPPPPILLLGVAVAALAVALPARRDVPSDGRSLLARAR